MQFASALQRDEAVALARFQELREVEHALKNPDFAVISLNQVIEAGGYKTVTLDEHPEVIRQILGKQARRSEFMSPLVFPVAALAIARVGWDEVPQVVNYRTRLNTIQYSQRTWSGSWGWEKSVAWKGVRETHEQLSISAQLPPLPREARDAIEAYKAAHPLVLWEAEWTARHSPRDSLGDPAILLPIGNSDLHIVVYTWDLTPLERSALMKTAVQRF